jgi:hypothetical protein
MNWTQTGTRAGCELVNIVGNLVTDKAVGTRTLSQERGEE